MLPDEWEKSIKNPNFFGLIWKISIKKNDETDLDHAWRQYKYTGRHQNKQMWLQYITLLLLGTTDTQKRKFCNKKYYILCGWEYFFCMSVVPNNNNQYIVAKFVCLVGTSQCICIVVYMYCCVLYCIIYILFIVAYDRFQK